jgi:hypothetical protein
MITPVRAKGECWRPSAFENEKDKPFLPSSKPIAYGILHLFNSIPPQQE